MKMNLRIHAGFLGLLLLLPRAAHGVLAFGPNSTNDFGPTCPVTCKGMPEWFVTEPYCNLWVKDIPLGYQPAKGPAVALQLAYKQRDEGTGTSVNEFSFGKYWHSEWRSFARPVIGGVQVFMPGGGVAFYPNTNGVNFYTSTKLETPSAAVYRVVYPDGSATVYDMQATVDGTVNYYVTKSYDPAGQALTFAYDNQGSNPSVARLRYVIDGDGRTNQITYSGDIGTNYWNQPPSTFSTNLVVRIIDAFGRTNWFDHDSTGQLTRVRDVQGLESSFLYDANSWMTNLITPYGTTVFAAQDDVTNGFRSLQITDAGGGNHLWVFRASVSGLGITPPSLDTAGYSTTIGIRDYSLNNSFYWGPRQFGFLTHTNDPANLDTTEYVRGRRQHWLGVADNTALSMEQAFSPDGTTAGQRVWYDYPTSGSLVTQEQPLMTVQALPNGQTHFDRTERNEWGAVTNLISTWSVEAESPSLRTNRFVYSADGLDLLEAYDAAGNRVSGSSYANHLPVTVTNVLGEITRYTYNGNSQPTSVSNYTGLIITNLYFTSGDYPGWLQSSIDNAGSTPLRTNSFTYTNGLVYTHTDERGSVTTNTWDALSRLTSSSDGLGTVSNIYDRLDLVGTIDRMGFTNGFVFDGMRRMIDRQDALGRNTHYEYCTCGALESVTDALSNTTTYTYDAGGRQIGTYSPDGYWVTNQLDLLGRAISSTDSAGISLTNGYNNQGLLYAVSNAWGQVSYKVVDVLDRVISQTDANGVVVTNAYDLAGRLRTTVTPVNNARQSYGYTLNVAGPTSYTNALTNVTLLAYDVYGRKTNEVSGSATTALTTNSFSYTPDGLLTTLRDGNGHLTTWNHDRYGRLTNKVDHLGTNAFIYGYDANNRMTSRTTPAKGTTTYGYDAVGNLTSVDYPVSSDLTLQYDALNRLTNLLDGVGTTTFSYNQVGQLLSEDGPWANDTVSYTHTNRLRTALSLQQPSGSWAMTYAWDSTKRLTNVTSSAGGFGYHYLADKPMRVGKIALPYGHYTTNSYDTLARLRDTYLANSGDAILNDHGYTFNVGNQRTIQTRQGVGYTNTVDYGYDPLGQLTSAFGKEEAGTSRLHEQFAYQYDPAGSLVSRTNNALIESFTVDALNQLTNVSRTGTLTVSGNTSSAATNVTVNGQTASRYADLMFAKDGFMLTNGTNTFTAIAQNTNGIADTNVIAAYLPAANSYTFDANGNLTFDGQKAFEYDDESQLIRITQTNVFKTEFSYDGRMRLRVKKEFSWAGAWTQTSETRYLYDGMLAIQERDGNNTPLVSYTRGQDLSGTFEGAGGIGGLLARTDHTQTSALLKTAFYHADGNGNITAMMSTNGLIVAWYQYSPFGTILAQSGPLADANVYRFSSKEFHVKSSLYYYAYRFYSPDLQRWLNQDPIQEAGGFNLYKFVENSPVGLVDRDGRHPLILGLIIFFLLEETIERPPPPPPPLPKFEPPIPPGTPTIGPCRSYAGSDMLNAMGGAHLAGTEMGQQQAEFMASAITAGLPISKIGSLKGANMIDPSKVRFSQSSIKGMFNDGGSIGELAGGLKNGTVKPIDVPPIRLVEKDCKLFSLDNRRLEAFRQAGVDIPYRMATPEEIAAEAWKFTTQNGGTSIRVRGQ